MIIILDDKHKGDLKFLNKLSPDIIAEFGKISVEFLRNGANKKLFSSAAQKLGVELEVIQRVVEGLSHLFSEASRYMLSEADFTDSLLVLGFPPELNELLKELYFENRKEVRSILYELFPHLEHYSNLSWRLDVQLASRTQRGPVTEPVFQLKLDTIPGGSDEIKSIFLESDPASLKHVLGELETALAEIRTNNSRRILRNIK